MSTPPPAGWFDHEIRVDDDGDQTCAPIASFSVAGTTFRAESHISSSDCPAIGSVEILAVRQLGVLGRAVRTLLPDRGVG